MTPTGKALLEPRPHRFSTDAAYRLMEECACECERCFAESRCDVHWTRHLPNSDTILAIEEQAAAPLRAALLSFVRFHADMDQRNSCSICQGTQQHRDTCLMEQARKALAANPPAATTVDIEATIDAMHDEEADENTALPAATYTEVERLDRPGNRANLDRQEPK